MNIKEQLESKNIPTVGNKIDVDAWAQSLGYFIEDNQLKEGEKRAVAVSPEHGAGWSTWNAFSPLDPVVNLIILTLRTKGSLEEFRSLYDYIEGDGATEKARVIAGSMENLDIEWVHEDVAFRVVEYDGYERIEYASRLNWL